MAKKESRNNRNSIKENKFEGGNKLVFNPSDDVAVEISAVSAEDGFRDGKHRRRKLFEKYLPKLHTVRFRIWASFFAMMSVMIAAMWVVALVFFPAGYNIMQRRSLTDEGRRLREEFTVYEHRGEDFKPKIDEFSRKQNSSVFIFSLAGDGAVVPKYSSTVGIGYKAAGLDDNVNDWFVSQVTADNVDYTFNSDSIDAIQQSSINIYGTRTTVGETTYYMCVSAMPLFAFSGFSLTSILLVVTIVLLAAGVFVAYAASGSASAPIKKLAKDISDMKGGGKKELKPTGFTEVDELQEAFTKAMDDVERNNRFRRDLLSNVSHDMRTPLTMIQAYAEMIRDITAGNKEKSTKNASTIIAETGRLNSLINEVMELSKLEAGVVEIHRRNFDFTEKVKEVIDRFVGLNDARGYDITADIQKGLFVDADPDNIDRVLYNLIGNAINYTGDDKKVRVVCKKVDDRIETHIIDTGKGISKDDLPTVWDKYYRLVQDKRRVMGSGLGLSIVKTVLDLHDVEYGVVSELGKGSDFYFCLPAVKSGSYALGGMPS